MELSSKSVESLSKKYVEEFHSSHDTHKRLLSYKKAKSWFQWLKQNKYITDVQYSHYLQKITTDKSVQYSFDKDNSNKWTDWKFKDFFLLSLTLISISTSLFLLYIHIKNKDDIGLLKNAQNLKQEKIIAYTGILKKQTGEVVIDPFDATFRLYSSLDGSKVLHEVDCRGLQGVKPNYNGLFILRLGGDCADVEVPEDVLRGKSVLFLGVTVGNGQELKPRMRVLLKNRFSN